MITHSHTVSAVPSTYNSTHNLTYNLTYNPTSAPDPPYKIDPTRYIGKPSDPTGRISQEIRSYELLGSLLIPYIRLDHNAMPTVEACQEIDKLLELKVYKNLFLRNAQKTGFYLLMLPGNKKFKTSVLSRQQFSPIICETGIYENASGYHARFRQYPCPYE